MSRHLIEKVLAGPLTLRGDIAPDDPGFDLCRYLAVYQDESSGNRRADSFQELGADHGLYVQP